MNTTDSSVAKVVGEIANAPAKTMDVIVNVQRSITNNEIMKHFNMGLAMYLLVCLVYLYILNYFLQHYLNDKLKIRRMSYDELVVKTLISAIAISLFMAIFPMFSYHLNIPLASIAAIAYVKYA